MFDFYFISHRLSGILTFITMMTPINPVSIDKYPQQLCATSLSLAAQEIRKNISTSQTNVDVSKTWYVVLFI